MAQRASARRMNYDWRLPGRGGGEGLMIWAHEVGRACKRRKGRHILEDLHAPVRSEVSAIEVRVDAGKRNNVCSWRKRSGWQTLVALQ